MSVKNKLIIGTWPLSGDFGARSLATIESCITKAVDAGIRRFDTAPNYGLGFAESAIGMVLANEPDIEIFTKCGNRPFVGKDFLPDAIEESVEQSLRRLRTDKLAGLFLHNPRTEIADYEPVVKRLEKLRSDGRVRLIGLSGAKGYDYSAVPDGRLDMYQQDANLLYLDELRDAGDKFGSFFARSPLATGILSGRLSAGAVFPADDHRSGWLKGARLESLCARVEAIKAVLPDGVDVPSAARRFLLHNDAVGSLICGIGRPEHLDGLISDIDAGPLPHNCVEQLNALYDQDFGRPEEEAALGY